MALSPGGFGLYAGGSPGGDADDKLDIKSIYRSLAAAYHWTYEQIDSHTLAEAQELFHGWDTYPPTNILVKAIAKGFGYGTQTETDKDEVVVPSEAQDAMQRSAVAAIASKADPKWFPVMRGKDRGLPKASPVFDLTALREKNLEVLRKRVKGASGRV